MGTIFKLDSKEFNSTIDKYLDLSRRERVDEVNRRAANICARAAGLTKKANIDQIVRDMKAVETITASYLKTTKKRGTYVALGKGGKTTQGKSTVQYMGKSEALAIANWRLARGKRKGFFRAFPSKLAGPGRGKSGGTASQFYSRFVKRARSSSAYIAAGWLNAYRFFSSISKKAPLPIASTFKEARFFQKIIGSAGRGKGIAATPGGDRIRAVFFNAADGVERIGGEPLKRAMDIETADMIVKIEEMEQKALNKVSK
jgi:hypothetical protein